MMAALIYFGIPQLRRPQPELEQVVPVELVQSGDALVAGSPGEQTAKAPQDETPPATTQATAKSKPAPPTQLAKPQPKHRAEPRPHKEPPPPADDFTAQLKAIEAEQQRAARSNAPSRSGAGTSDHRLGGGGEAGGQLGGKDVIRAQIERHWEFDVAALGSADIVVTLHVRLDHDGAVRRVDVVDDPRYSGNPAYRPLADSARRAVQVAAPFTLPEGWSAITGDMVLYLNPREALR
ncbi:MAG TPA: hypothetical protein VK558_10510 [Patescibacteria group bacterium]|nr:hypothetical protein [Patescibacteria group bacterium]